MTEATIQNLKKVKVLRLLVQQLRMMIAFFLRFPKRNPAFFFHSRKLAFSRASRSRSNSKLVPNQLLLKLPDGITLYHNVISYPILLGSVTDYSGGLLSTETNQLIKEAIHYRGYSSQDTSSFDDSLIHKRKPGTIEQLVFFGGILYNNFGHFLLESLGRLWAYETVKELDPYILFYEDMGRSHYLEKRNFIYQVFTGLSIPHNRILFLNVVTHIKTVIIPAQKYGYELCRHPDEIFLMFLGRFRFPQITPAGFEDARNIYVSRSSLPAGSGRPIGESLFEKYLSANGYHIFHPEKHTIYEQLTITAPQTK